MFTLTPAWPMVCCTAWAISGIGGCVGTLQPDLEAVGIASLGQQRLGLGDVELPRVVRDRSEQAERPEGLLHGAAALEELLATMPS